MHPGKPGLVNPGLIEWLRHVGIPLENTLWNSRVNRYDCTVTFNGAIKQALSTQHDHYLFADFDMNPSPANAAPFLACEADLVGAEFDTGEAGCWKGGHIHSGFWRTSREVLESIPSVQGRPRWFEWRYMDDGAGLATCLCVPFCEKVTAAGWSIAVAGKAGHLPQDRRGW